MRVVALTLSTFLLAGSSVYPAVAQDRVQPSAPSQTDNQTVGRDWKAKPSDSHETAGNAAGKSPDSANQDDSKKVDRDWRVNDQKNGK